MRTEEDDAFGVAKYLFDAAELVGEERSIHVIYRNPLLFGPKSGAPVTFPKGIQDRKIEEIGAMIVAGLSGRAICKELGVVNRKRISRIRAALSGQAGRPLLAVRRVPHLYKKPGEEVARRMISEGFSNASILKALGLSLSGKTNNRIGKIRSQMEKEAGKPLRSGPMPDQVRQAKHLIRQKWSLSAVVRETGLNKHWVTLIRDKIEGRKPYWITRPSAQKTHLRRARLPISNFDRMAA